jgi:hypothetical protein
VPDFLLLAHTIVGLPVLLAQRHPSRLSLLGIALALFAVLFPGLGKDSASASGTAPSPSVQATSGGGPGVAVASFSVTDDLATALVGLNDPGDVTFVGPAGAIGVDGTGTLRIPLDFSLATGPTTVTMSVSGEPADVVQVNYYPAQYYRSMGIDSAGVIDLYTTLPRSNNEARREDTSPPTGAPPAVDQAEWGRLLPQDGFPAAEASLDDQIRQLYIQFDELNDPNVGTVCAGGMTGIEMYSAISLHSCYVTCTGYAQITDAFLGSLETPARYISLGGPYSYLTDGVLVESSESHDTTDMWVNGEWQWLDPTLRVLQATGPDGLPLTLDAVMQALSDASTRNELSFTRLNPDTDEWQTLSWGDEDAAFTQDLSDYLSADKIMLVGKA